MRLGVDATCLAGPRSGVGHSAASVLSAMVELDPDLSVRLMPVSVSSARHMKILAPSHPRIEVLRTPVPARIAGWVWTKATWPPAELFCGDVDVFWGPNFLLPPLVHAFGVVTIHDLGFMRLPSTASKHTARYSSRVGVWAARADRVIVPSRFTANEVADVFPNVADSVRVVPPGLRADFLQPGGPLPRSRLDQLGVHGPFVLFAGNLEARKDVGTLLTAFDKLRAEMQLVLAGRPGPGWEEMIDGRDMSGVVLTGPLPDAELAALMRAAAVFAWPSVYEGFGMPPLEAMACGTPVVAADIEVTREVLGEDAVLVPARDPGALAEAILATAGSVPPAGAAERAATFTPQRAAVETLRVFAEGP